MVMRFLGFLWPGTRKLLLFAMFAFLCVAGVIQAYAFIDDVPGIEKPLLYDQLRTFDFWLPWIIFTAPFHIPLSIICGMFDFCTPIFSFFPRLGAVRFPVSSVVYSLLASSWLVHSWDRWISGAASMTRRFILVIPLVMTGIMAGPTMFLLPFVPQEATFSISTFLLVYAILTFYSISCYGLYRVILEYRFRVREKDFRTTAIYP